MCNLEFPFAFFLLLKNHLIIGILDRRGTPVPEFSLFSSSKPPSNTISPFLTLTKDSNFCVAFPGGAFSPALPKKALFSTLIFSVTFSSAETNGFILTLKLASVFFQVPD